MAKNKGGRSVVKDRTGRYIPYNPEENEDVMGSEGSPFGYAQNWQADDKRQIRNVVESLLANLKDYKSQLQTLERAGNLSAADRLNEKGVVKGQLDDWKRYAKLYGKSELAGEFDRAVTALNNLHRWFSRSRKTNPEGRA